MFADKKKVDIIDDNATATLEYGDDGKSTLSIRNGNGTLLYQNRVENCHDLWGEFYLCGELFKFNFFDDPTDYGVGCWVYPNGDSDKEITLDVEIYEGGKLVRKNQ